MVYFTICLRDIHIFLAFSEVLHFPMGFISHGNFFPFCYCGKKFLQDSSYNFVLKPQ